LALSDEQLQQLRNSDEQLGNKSQAGIFEAGPYRNRQRDQAAEQCQGKARQLVISDLWLFDEFSAFWSIGKRSDLD
jgi:hypothetical protein